MARSTCVIAPPKCCCRCNHNFYRKYRCRRRNHIRGRCSSHVSGVYESTTFAHSTISAFVFVSVHGLACSCGHPRDTYLKLCLASAGSGCPISSRIAEKDHVCQTQTPAHCTWTAVGHLCLRRSEPSGHQSNNWCGRGCACARGRVRYVSAPFGPWRQCPSTFRQGLLALYDHAVRQHVFAAPQRAYFNQTSGFQGNLRHSVARH